MKAHKENPVFNAKRVESAKLTRKNDADTTAKSATQLSWGRRQSRKVHAYDTVARRLENLAMAERDAHEDNWSSGERKTYQAGVCPQTQVIIFHWLWAPAM